MINNKKKLVLLIVSVTVGFWPLVFFTLASALSWRRPFFDYFDIEPLLHVSMILGALLFGLYIKVITGNSMRAYFLAAFSIIIFYVVSFYSVLLASFTLVN